MAGSGGLDSTGDSPPRHDRCVGRQSPLQDLVPADQPFSFAGKERFDSLDEVALQLVLVFQSLSLYPLLALDTVLPAQLGDLIPADANEIAGNKADDFGQHILEKLESFFVAGTIDVNEKTFEFLQDVL